MAPQTADLRKYNYFSGLSQKSLEALAAGFSVAAFAAGAQVVKEGDAGGTFYFIKEGRLEATKKTLCGQEAKLSVIGSGQGFGEMALLSGDARVCSIRALTASTLFSLPKSAFAELVMRESAFRNMLQRKADDHAYYNKIKVLQPFALLDPDRMYALMARMNERTYAAGEDIIVQGEKGDYYYIVKSGRVEVLKKGKDREEASRVAVLTEGDGFGEEALIRDDPRNATCRAMEDTVVCALDKVDFSQILKASFLDNIFAEDINLETYRDKYVIIDARVPEEYGEEHIQGAVSIPVEALRRKYVELDPKKEYITYCTNDARGMVAAFLLKNHGFKARCLRGGISSWSGPVAAGLGA